MSAADPGTPALCVRQTHATALAFFFLRLTEAPALPLSLFSLDFPEVLASKALENACLPVPLAGHWVRQLLLKKAHFFESFKATVLTLLALEASVHSRSLKTKHVAVRCFSG